MVSVAVKGSGLMVRGPAFMVRDLVWFAWVWFDVVQSCSILFACDRFSLVRFDWVWFNPVQSSMVRSGTVQSGSV